MQIINKNSLVNFYYQIKHYPDIPKDVFVFLVVVLVALGAFSIGRSSVLGVKRAGELKILDVPLEATITSNSVVNGILGTTAKGSDVASAALVGSGKYVGAKSGKTYYFPWCSGVKRIKESNKVWFSTKEEAEVAGYKPSASCPGI